MSDYIPDHVFRAYDIRGLYPNEINEDFFYKFGQAVGTKISLSNNKIVNVCADGRLSSNSLKKKLIEGVLSTGVNVNDIGVIIKQTL